MALDDFMRLLLSGGQPTTAPAPSGIAASRFDGPGALSDPGVQSAIAGQNGPQIPVQAAYGAQTLQGQPMPQNVPSGAPGPSGGGPVRTFGDFIQTLFMPEAAARNRTISWLQTEGMDEGTATLLAGNKPALQNYLLNRTQGSKPLVINDKLVDPTTGAVIADYGDSPPPQKRDTAVIDGKLVDTQTGEVIGDYSAEEAPKGPDQKAEGDLRREYLSRPEFKRYDEVRAAYERVSRSAEDATGAGDLGLVFGFMKMLDPGSVVREGEFANAQNTAGVPERVRTLYNQVVSGERLSPEQRAEFKRLAQQYYQGEVASLEGINEEYRARADAYGLDAGRIITMPKVYETQPTHPTGGGALGSAVPTPDRFAPGVNPDAGKADRLPRPTVRDQREYDMLPPGAEYIAPDGSIRRKGN